MQSLPSLPPQSECVGRQLTAEVWPSLSLSLSLSLLPTILVLNYSIISDLILCEPRRSVTELEVDILAADILNRHELSLGRSVPSTLCLPLHGYVVSIGIFSGYVLQFLMAILAWQPFGRRKDKEEKLLTLMTPSPLLPLQVQSSSHSCIDTLT